MGGNIASRMLRSLFALLREFCRSIIGFDSNFVDFLTVKNESDLVQQLEKFLFLENQNW